jgi:hypothetical protein
MKKEYDFLKGVWGRFYNRDAKLNLPIYLDADNRRFIEGLARKRKSDMSEVVNELIRGDREIAKALG